MAGSCAARHASVFLWGEAPHVRAIHKRQAEKAMHSRSGVCRFSCHQKERECKKKIYHKEVFACWKVLRGYATTEKHTASYSREDWMKQSSCAASGEISPGRAWPAMTIGKHSKNCGSSVMLSRLAGATTGCLSMKTMDTEGRSQKSYRPSLWGRWPYRYTVTSMRSPVSVMRKTERS